jgi:HEAT repeat protein
MNDFDEDISQNQEPDLEMALEALQSLDSQTISADILYGLSRLTTTDLERVKPGWDALPANLRQRALEQMTEFSELNFEADYRAMGLLGLDDVDSNVRKAAIGTLWEDESLETMNRLIKMAQWDEALEVRATAASALGHYILLGELGDIPENETTPAQDAALNLWMDEGEDVEIRRRALEAIANCSHSIVPEAINEAYASPDKQLRISAVFAMGRTCNERWEEEILREIDSDDAEMRYEAARAAGELGLVSSIPRLAQLVIYDDIEIKLVTIWSLGEIGGKEAIRVLERLSEEIGDETNDELADAIEDALATASLMGDDLPFMFDLDDESERDAPLRDDDYLQ